MVDHEPSLLVWSIYFMTLVASSLGAEARGCLLYNYGTYIMME